MVIVEVVLFDCNASKLLGSNRKGFVDEFDFLLDIWLKLVVKLFIISILQPT